MFRRKPMYKNYISALDKLLYEYDHHHELNPAQKREVEKHQRVAEKRDNPEREPTIIRPYQWDDPQIWEGF